MPTRSSGPPIPPGDPLFEGARAVVPLLLGLVPFGLIVGVTVGASSFDVLAGWSTSFLIFAGASQLALVQVVDAGAPLAVAVATVLIINARFFMYSASLAPHFDGLPLGYRLLAPYLLTDQAYAMSIARFDGPTELAFRLRFYLGAALTLWIVWQLSTTGGLLLGTQIPPAWSLQFSVPLAFLALLVPALRDRPAIVAAIVGGAVALLGLVLPYKLGLIVGASAGVVAGALAETALRR